MKREIAAGVIPDRPERCECCGETRGSVGYHAEDYTFPFGPWIYEYALCFRCHMTLHTRRRNPDGWRRYLDHLSAGVVFKPLPDGAWAAIWAYYRDPGAAIERMGPPRGDTLLHWMDRNRGAPSALRSADAPEQHPAHADRLATLRPAQLGLDIQTK